MEFRRNLIGECGIYCGDCRLFVLKKCEGCSNEEAKYPYYECVENKATNSRGECQEVPCEKHYGPMEVYAEEFLDWKRQEIAKA